MTPFTLAEAPELASLELLRCAVTVSRAALLAVHPELQESDSTEAVITSGSLAAVSADALLTHLEALETALGRYRELAAMATPSSTPG